MSRILIYNAHAYLAGGPVYPGWLLSEGSQILACEAGMPPDLPAGSLTRTIDARQAALLPGFIDLHAHGALGHEAMDASPHGLQEMARGYARSGVTGFLATTWTASRDATQAVLEAVRGLPERLPGGASLLGVHLEGPYFNPQRCGAQDAAHIRRAERQEALQFLESGVVRLIALAPEYTENHWLVEECVRRGIRVSAGHTSASYEEMKRAVALGVRQVTHCFNAMGGLGHRAPGTVGAALALPELQCELIADNIHVHPAAQKLLVKAKGPAGVILITDSVRGAGLPDGEYRLDDRVMLIQGGAARLPGGTLAGSTLTMNHALRNIIQNTGLSLAKAWPMSSRSAAEAIGLGDRKGSLEPGKDADLVLLDDHYEVMLTIAAGQVVE